MTAVHSHIHATELGFTAKLAAMLTSTGAQTATSALISSRGSVRRFVLQTKTRSVRVTENTAAHLVVELTLGLALCLGLARQGEVGELVLRALRVGSKQVRFFRVQEGESLRARPVRLYAHFCFYPTKQQGPLSQLPPPKKKANEKHY